MRHSLPREIRRIRKIYKIRRHPCRFRYHTVETVRFSANFQRHLRKHPASFPLENYSITKEFRGQKNSFFYPNYKKNIKIEREAGKILESIKIEDQFAFTLYLRVNLETHFSLLSTRLKKKKKKETRNEPISIYYFITWRAKARLDYSSSSSYPRRAKSDTMNTRITSLPPFTNFPSPTRGRSNSFRKAYIKRDLPALQASNNSFGTSCASSSPSCSSLP